MRIGMTGTREGMTEAQKEAFKFLLNTILPTHLHHGDCVGADAEAHGIGRELGLLIKQHPPVKKEFRAFTDYDELGIAKSYYARNRDIVNETAILVATPLQDTEQPKGGTWYTVGYARMVKKPLIIIWPNGTVDTERLEQVEYDRSGGDTGLAPTPED